jgi:hypothetical protein
MATIAVRGCDMVGEEQIVCWVRVLKMMKGGLKENAEK